MRRSPHPEPSSTSPASTTQIVIFGATGDLAQRKLAPALHSLSCGGLLPEGVEITGIGRSPLDDETFRARLYEGVQTYARLHSSPHLCKLWSDLGSIFHYAQIADASPAAIHDLFAAHPLGPVALPRNANLLIYLATPPEAVPEMVSSLGNALQWRRQSDQAGWTRIVLEKPFGLDEESARSLDDLLARSFSEHEVYRIDHYLGKETVQNLLAFRFANCIFEPLWNAKWVQHVQITVAESIGVEGRAPFYDRVGVVRDVVQNHVMQLLSLIAMEPPPSLDSEPLRDEKVRVLKSVRPLASTDFILGQFEGYRSESAIPADSRTPTYAALRLHIDNERWRGVPFYVRTGKMLTKKTTEITIQFRQAEHRLLGAAHPHPNRLSLHIQPEEGMRLQIAVKAPGAGMDTRIEDMSFLYRDRYPDMELPDAYERLLLDALRGDPSLFIRCDEIEYAWRIVRPLIESSDTPSRYSPGSWGPQAASRLFEENASDWMCRSLTVDGAH